jgi:hypothetical protein
MGGCLTSLFLALGLLLPASARGEAKILHLSPDIGPMGGGTRVRIEVDEILLLGPVRVEFGGRPASQVHSQGLSVLEAITPPGIPGPASVRVVYGFGRSSTAPAVFTYLSPPPRLLRLEPLTISAGSEDLTLSVEGEDFTPMCSVRVGETRVPSTFLSRQRLYARIPARLLARAGNLDVQVIDPTLGGGASGVVSLMVANPAPQLAALTAPPLKVGGPPASVIVRGRAFRPESYIQIAGVAAPTQYHTDQELAAGIPSGLLAKPGELPVVVVTPGPGGGTSQPMSLSVAVPFPGRYLVFTSNRRGGRNHIYLLDRETGRLDPLEEANSRNSSDDYPTISADGRFIAFQSDRHAGQYHVFLFDRETRSLDSLPELNHPTAFDGFPRISPDGRFIVFESDRLQGRPKIFLFDRQTRTLSELSQANEATADDGLAALSN